jgi:hypothetical protein
MPPRKNGGSSTQKLRRKKNSDQKTKKTMKMKKLNMTENTITAYCIHEHAKAKSEFRNVFGMEISPFYDVFVSLLFKKICINPFKFDEWLHARYGDYEDRGKSMLDIVSEHFGEAGVNLINKLL